jgi:hypothetical protein
MKKFLICLTIILGSLFIRDRDGVYDVSGNRNRFIDDKREKQDYEGEVFEDRDHDLRGYVQDERYSRKIPVRGEWSGQGRMILRDDYGNRYEMDVEDEEY